MQCTRRRLRLQSARTPPRCRTRPAPTCLWSRLSPLLPLPLTILMPLRPSRHTNRIPMVVLEVVEVVAEVARLLIVVIEAASQTAAFASTPLRPHLRQSPPRWPKTPPCRRSLRPSRARWRRHGRRAVELKHRCTR